MVADGYRRQRPSQSSTTRSSTRANSRVFRVIRVSPRLSAWPAMRTSYGPIGVPFRAGVLQTKAREWSLAVETLRPKHAGSQLADPRGPFYASKALHTRTLPDPSTVTVVGAYDPSATEFDDFVKNLASSLGTVAGSPVPIAQRRSLKKYANRWHAKIFIARNATHHGFAVVGSSNLTRNAFDASPSNNEADVVIWDDSNTIAQKVATEALTGRQDGAPDAAPLPNVIVGNYDPNDPRNSAPLQMNDRLSTLWQDVLSATS